MNNVVIFLAVVGLSGYLAVPSIARATNEGVRKAVNELFLDKELKPITKRQAVKVLLDGQANGSEKVLRCSEVELSPTLSIRKKK